MSGPLTQETVFFLFLIGHTLRNLFLFTANVKKIIITSTYILHESPTSFYFDLKVVLPFNSYFKALHMGQFLTKFSEIHLLLLTYCILTLIAGKCFISILKIWVQKSFMIEFEFSKLK